MERFYHDESGRILASLIRLLGDFDLAEEAMQEAFAAALQQWPNDGWTCPGLVDTWVKLPMPRDPTVARRPGG